MDIIFLCKRIIYALKRVGSKKGSVVEEYIVKSIYTNTTGVVVGTGNKDGNDITGVTDGDVKFQTFGLVRSSSTTVLEDINDMGNENILAMLSILEHVLVTDMLELILFLDVKFLIEDVTSITVFDCGDTGRLYFFFILFIPECNLLLFLLGRFA